MYAIVIQEYQAIKDPESHYNPGRGATAGPINVLSYEMAYRQANNDLSSDDASGHDSFGVTNTGATMTTTKGLPSDLEMEIVERNKYESNINNNNNNKLFERSCLKKMVCSIGGQLLSFKLIQSRKPLAEYSSEILKSGPGPHISTIEQQGI